MSVDLLPAATLRSAAAGGELDICFAGVQFSFVGAPHLLELLALAAASRGLEQSGAQSGNSRVFARLRCRVQPADPRSVWGPNSGREMRELAYEWSGARGQAITWGASAQVATAEGRWSADAHLEPNRGAARNLLTLLAYSLVHFSGGVVLHAASVELPDGVVAFVGPSGAGKSTACAHADGARLFSADRLAVVPASRPNAEACGWSAHALPEGTPLAGAGLPLSDAAGSPLRAILRMRQAPEGCRFEPCTGIRALALLRESSFHTNRGVEAEGEVLCRLERLACSVPVGNLHFGLGTQLGRLLRSWLQDGTFRRGAADTSG